MIMLMIMWMLLSGRLFVLRSRATTQHHDHFPVITSSAFLTLFQKERRSQLLYLCLDLFLFHFVCVMHLVVVFFRSIHTSATFVRPAHHRHPALFFCPDSMCSHLIDTILSFRFFAFQHHFARILRLTGRSFVIFRLVGRSIVSSRHD